MLLCTFCRKMYSVHEWKQLTWWGVRCFWLNSFDVTAHTSMVYWKMKHQCYTLATGLFLTCSKKCNLLFSSLNGPVCLENMLHHSPHVLASFGLAQNEKHPQPMSLHLLWKSWNRNQWTRSLRRWQPCPVSHFIYQRLNTGGGDWFLFHWGLTPNELWQDLFNKKHPLCQ